MKFFIALNFLLTSGLAYLIYENHRQVRKPIPGIIVIEEKILDFKKELAENNKLLHDLKARLEKLDKNVNGHSVGDSLRDHIGSLQSDLEALEKKLKQ